MKIPVCVREMAKELKLLCDLYREGQTINNLQFEADLKFLKEKRPDLFFKAFSDFYLGKKRVELIKSVLGGSVQYNLY